MDRADGWIYAAYVIINLALFTIKTPKVAIPCTCSRLRHCRAWWFRNSDNAPQGALELIREMSLFRRRTDRMLKGLGSSNPLLSATQSGMVPYIMEKR